MLKAALTLTMVGLVGFSMAYPKDELVTELDQWTDLSFGLYSGYVPIDKT